MKTYEFLRKIGGIMNFINITELFLILFVSVGLYMAIGFSKQAKIIPLASLTGIGILLIINITLKIVKNRRIERTQKNSYTNIKIATFVIICALYIYLLPIAGYIISNTALILLLLFLLGNKKWWHYIATILITNLSVYLIFVKYLKMDMP